MLSRIIHSKGQSWVHRKIIRGVLYLALTLGKAQVAILILLSPLQLSLLSHQALAVLDGAPERFTRVRFALFAKSRLRLPICKWLCLDIIAWIGNLFPASCLILYIIRHFYLDENLLVKAMYILLEQAVRDNLILTHVFRLFHRLEDYINELV